LKSRNEELLPHFPIHARSSHAIIPSTTASNKSATFNFDFREPPPVHVSDADDDKIAFDMRGGVTSFSLLGLSSHAPREHKD
jgi:hypothetical protein